MSHTGSALAQGASTRPWRVHVQDLEGDCRNTLVLFIGDDLSALKRAVAQAFEYKQPGGCLLWTRLGARVEDIALIRDEDVLCATDGSVFPHALRESHLPGLERVGHPRALEEQHFMWGWPRIGQLVGGGVVRDKLAVGWRTSGALASVLLLINFVAFFAFAAQPAEGQAAGGEQALLRTHFWFAGLALMGAMFSMVLAALLSMHINLLPRDDDVFWFLKEYGTWLLGWPTALVVVSLVCTCGQLVAGALLNYPTLEADGWVFLALVAAFAAVGSRLFITLSSACWSRVNATSITKVWPGDPWMEGVNATPLSSNH